MTEPDRQPNVADEIRGAVRELLAALPDARRDAATVPFEDEETRRSWTYLPGQRPGVRLASLDREAAVAVSALLGSTLSETAQAQVATIRGLEDVLARIEDRRGRDRDGQRRHAGDYWLLVAGDPEGDLTWRLGGHHVTVGATVVGDAVRATPLFLGANPARLPDTPPYVTRPLPHEEELAYDLVCSLSDAARAACVLGGDDAVPDDILTGDAPRVDGVLEPAGVALGELGATSADIARTLVEVFLARLRPELREVEAARVLTDEALARTHVAWAGTPADGEPHYYRLQGPRLLVEVDNVRGGANHIHTVWRDPAGDFGDDLLRTHLAESPH